MKHISKNKGQRLKDKYKDGAEKLYALCDYINKKAMTWYPLNIEFSAEEVELIKRVQQTMEDMTEIPKKIAADEDIYELLDLGYDILIENCEKCDGIVKVIDFATNGVGQEFNIYKCEDCGFENTESYPNQYEEIKIHFYSLIDILDKALKTDKIEHKKKKELNDSKSELTELVEIILENSENTTIPIKAIRESVIAEIETNGQTYKEFSLYKNHFDRNIKET